MRATDIEIYKVFLTTIDATLPCPNCSEVKLDEEDALYGYIAKLCVASDRKSTRLNSSHP